MLESREKDIRSVPGTLLFFGSLRAGGYRITGGQLTRLYSTFIMPVPW